MCESGACQWEHARFVGVGEGVLAEGVVGRGGWVYRMRAGCVRRCRTVQSVAHTSCLAMRAVTRISLHKLAKRSIEPRLMKRPRLSRASQRFAFDRR